MKTPPLALLALALLTVAQADEAFVNSVGMRLLPLRAGTFQMGESNPTPAKQFEVAGYLQQGDWDEHPVHAVTLTQPCLLAETEVTDPGADELFHFEANRLKHAADLAA